MKKIIDFKPITKEEHEELVDFDEYKTLGYQYTIMYMSRIHSLSEFIFGKILSLRNKLFSDFEASEVVEAFTIKMICDWEWYSERIICECLKNDTSMLSREIGLILPVTITTDECMAYLNGLGYFDLKSCSNLKSIAKKVLTKELNPFANIGNEAKNKIDDFYIFRNYVAHKSIKAKKALIKTYEKYNQIDFQEVGEFLLNKEFEKDNLIRFQNFGGSFWLSSFQILEFSFPKIYKWICRDEQTYNDKCHIRFHYLRSLIPYQSR